MSNNSETVRETKNVSMNHDYETVVALSDFVNKPCVKRPLTEKSRWRHIPLGINSKSYIMCIITIHEFWWAAMCTKGVIRLQALLGQIIRDSLCPQTLALPNLVKTPRGDNIYGYFDFFVFFCFHILQQSYSPYPWTNFRQIRGKFLLKRTTRENDTTTSLHLESIPLSESIG